MSRAHKIALYTVIGLVVFCIGWSLAVALLGGSVVP